MVNGEWGMEKWSLVFGPWSLVGDEERRRKEEGRRMRRMERMWMGESVDTGNS